ncbi:solute carrier family 66 member 2 [Chiloscyllium plagiosum]|uniref:solute carrier family 66 member 2 n=1 Tax=Chiloscyllium plagiosum TaxID=36176 RepID=UPI001CB82B56|nr:solute carrier family 66 member 2 [Chiloscyllium plagiosum]
MLWEVRDTDDVSGSHSCGKCVHIQLLKKRVAALKKELGDLRLIRENENFLDRTFCEVITPSIPEERREMTMMKEVMIQVQETPGEVPLVNKLNLLETVETDDTASPRGRQICQLKIGVEAQSRSQISCRVVHYYYLCRFGKHFELTLLWQSIVLIITMLALLHLCCTVQSSSRMSTSRHLFTDFDPRYFWAWSRFLDYIQFCLTFTVLCLLITYLLIDSELYVESLGFSAVLIEAMLGMPQLLQNFKNKSTAGMSVKMVLLWTLGDIFKTTYFIINATPVQFWICGTVQICIDIAIFFQVFIYGQGDHEKYM